MYLRLIRTTMTCTAPIFLSSTLLAQPQCISALLDDFENGLIDAPLETQGPCGVPTEASGVLTLGVPDGCSGLSGARTDPTQYVLCGDFDVSVDFELIDLPIPSTGAQAAGLSVRSVDTNGSLGTIELYRRFQIGDCAPADLNFKAWTTSALNCAATFEPTTVQSGRLRIERVGGAIRFYADEGGGWDLILEGTAEDDDVYILLFAANDENTQGNEVAFDNLSATGSGGPCPGDATGDGKVDFDDLTLVLGNFGLNCN